MAYVRRITKNLFLQSKQTRKSLVIGSSEFNNADQVKMLLTLRVFLPNSYRNVNIETAERIDRSRIKCQYYFTPRAGLCIQIMDHIAKMFLNREKREMGEQGSFLYFPFVFFFPFSLHIFFFSFFLSFFF